MFIKELKIKNFKCFADETYLKFQVPNENRGSGLNILVGNNNCGKSTILEALESLNIKTGKLPDELKNKNSSEEEMSIEITLTGKTNTFEEYEYKKDDNNCITIKLTEDKPQILNPTDNNNYTVLSTKHKLFEIASLKPTNDPKKKNKVLCKNYS